MCDAVNQDVPAQPGLESLLDALPQAVLVINRQGIITVANLQVSRVLNLPADTGLEGRPMWQALPPGLRETVAAMQRETLIYGTEARRDFELVLDDGRHKLLDLQLGAVNSKQGHSDFFSLTISEAVARQEVAELKKLDQLKSGFLSLVSHELRTPLTSIRGAVHLLHSMEREQDDPQNKLVSIIKDNSDRMIRLVNNLLEMVAIDNDTFVVTKSLAPVKEVFSKAMDQVHAVAAARFINLECHLDDAPAYVDSDRLGQYITHVLDNALKFTPTGGRILLSTFSLPGGGLELSIADTGCGVPPHARERIFDRFYQVEDPMTRCTGGAGVGLYLARTIVEKHEGEIWVDSSEGGGAVFHAKFPGASASHISVS